MQKPHGRTSLLKTVVLDVGAGRGFYILTTDLDKCDCLLSVRLTDIFQMFAEIVGVIVYGVASSVKKQPSQGVLHGDEAEEELGLACLVSSYTLPHQNSQPGGKGRQTARSKVLSQRARDT